MADAAISHPTPQPRPAPGPSAYPTLRLVTDGKAETCIAAGDIPASTTDSRESRWSRLQSAITDSNRWVVLAQAGKAYFTPPAVFTDRPASLAELADYARYAPWTVQPFVDRPYTDEDANQMVKTGAVRAAGIWWYRWIGYPYTVVSRYREWILQRPGRAIPVLLLVKLAASTSYGSWAVDNLLYPVAHAVAWVLL
jgi:hypothetical protein